MVTAERLKSMRKKQGLTQTDMSWALGVYRTTYTGYEGEYRKPDIEILRCIAEILKTTTDFLLGRTDDPTPPDQDEFDPTADDWYENAPDWLRDLYDDPEFQPLIERADVRKFLMRPEHYVMGLDPGATDDDKHDILRDMLSLWAWRMDQDKGK